MASTPLSVLSDSDQADTATRIENVKPTGRSPSAPIHCQAAVESPGPASLEASPSPSPSPSLSNCIDQYGISANLDDDSIDLEYADESGHNESIQDYEYESNVHDDGLDSFFGDDSVVASSSHVQNELSRPRHQPSIVFKQAPLESEDGSPINTMPVSAAATLKNDSHRARPDSHSADDIGATHDHSEPLTTDGDKPFTPVNDIEKGSANNDKRGMAKQMTSPLSARPQSKPLSNAKEVSYVAPSKLISKKSPKSKIFNKPIPANIPSTKSTSAKVPTTKSPTAKLLTPKSTAAKVPTAKPPPAKLVTPKPPPARVPMARPPPAKIPTSKPPPARVPMARPPPAKIPTSKPPPPKVPTGKPPPPKPSTAKPPPANALTARPSSTNAQNDVEVFTVDSSSDSFVDEGPKRKLKKVHSKSNYAKPVVNSTTLRMDSDEDRSFFPKRAGAFKDRSRPTGRKRAHSDDHNSNPWALKKSVPNPNKRARPNSPSSYPRPSKPGKKLSSLPNKKYPPASMKAQPQPMSSAKPATDCRAKSTLNASGKLLTPLLRSKPVQSGSVPAALPKKPKPVEKEKQHNLAVPYSKSVYDGQIPRVRRASTPNGPGANERSAANEAQPVHGSTERMTSTQEPPPHLQAGRGPWMSVPAANEQVAARPPRETDANGPANAIGNQPLHPRQQQDNQPSNSYHVQTSMPIPFQQQVPVPNASPESQNPAPAANPNFHPNHPTGPYPDQNMQLPNFQAEVARAQMAAGLGMGFAAHPPYNPYQAPNHVPMFNAPAGMNYYQNLPQHGPHMHMHAPQQYNQSFHHFPNSMPMQAGQPNMNIAMGMPHDQIAHPAPSGLGVPHRGGLRNDGPHRKHTSGPINSDGLQNSHGYQSDHKSKPVHRGRSTGHAKSTRVFSTGLRSMAAPSHPNVQFPRSTGLRSQPPAKKPHQGLEGIAKPILTQKARDNAAKPVSGIDKASNAVTIEDNKSGSDVNDELMDVSEDDEKLGDYVSQLNMMSQKSHGITSVEFNFHDCTLRGAIRWKCVVSAKVLPYTKGDVPMVASVCARTRKRAKQKSAKVFLQEVKKMRAAKAESEQITKAPSPEKAMEKEKEKEKEKAPPAQVGAKAESPPIKESILRMASSSLQHLWQTGILVEAPKFVYEVVEAQWQCTLTLDVKDMSIETVSHIAGSKKNAKQRVSVKGMRRLREMNVQGMDCFLTMENGAMSTALEKEDDGADTVNEDALNDMVRMSDDEGAESSVSSVEKDEGRNGRLFLLPKGYALTIASTEQECEDWLNTHITAGKKIGLFVDSPSARQSFDGENGVGSSQAQASKQLVDEVGRIICLSTGGHGLVVRGKTEGDGMDDGEKMSFWVPSALADVLESSEVCKYGHAFDEGLHVLEDEHNIACQKVDDVACTSLAITGIGRVGGEPFSGSLRELCKHWMRKDLPERDGVSIWSDGDHVPDCMQTEDGRQLAIGIFSAYLCDALQDCWRNDAHRKLVQMYGPGDMVKELTRRVMCRPR